MKKLSLTLFVAFLITGLCAQQKLKFTYDTAGNQILRDRVCATCLRAVLPQVSDSLLAETSLDNLKSAENFGIVAYPNPVTQLLYVDWEADSDLKPKTVQLFTMDGRQLISRTIGNGQREQEVDFAQYPPGLFVLQVAFTNGEKRTFKILKN
jgi:hypothetical protein